MREEPKEAEVVSHTLMLRAGFIRRLASGIYSWLPIGLRTLRRLEKIIREEMDRVGGQEVVLPFVQPKELWLESGRWEKYGKELLRFEDRNGREMCLGPTHEEVVTDLVRREVRSYRDLPLILYQIQTKFRDEIRPRFGVMRAREFVMKDAYSFDVDEREAEKTYEKMYVAYERIFERCGLSFRVVEAETGAIGGRFSHEFMVLADTGEDLILYCSACGYAANVERAEGRAPTCKAQGASGLIRKVSTPGMKTVQEVSSFLGVGPERLVKTLIYMTERGPVGLLIRGDRELNETKVRRALEVQVLELADEATVEAVTKAPRGFSGPLGLALPLYADYDLLLMRDFVTGANEEDAHLIGVNLSDIPIRAFFDLKVTREGDPCPACGASLSSQKGIEVGHIFKLGTTYSEAMGARYLDREGKERPIVMGCYGIGLGRTIAAAIEQNHDEDGMKLPLPLAPFEALVLPVNTGNADVVRAAELIYGQLLTHGIDCVIDDRQERPGVKFKDADLIGVPLRVTIGERGLKEGTVEIRHRRDGIVERVRTENAAQKVVDHVRRLRS
jgi:prolyl-tRNA synthetase